MVVVRDLSNKKTFRYLFINDNYNYIVIIKYFIAIKSL